MNCTIIELNLHGPLTPALLSYLFLSVTVVVISILTVSHSDVERVMFAGLKFSRCSHTPPPPKTCVNRLVDGPGCRRWIRSSRRFHTLGTLLHSFTSSIGSSRMNCLANYFIIQLELPGSTLTTSACRSLPAMATSLTTTSPQHLQPL